MNPHALLTRNEVCPILGQANQSLADMARKGFGPPCYSNQRGRGVQARYRRADVENYAQARAAGLGQRDASIWTAREAHRLTLATIAARYGATDPAFAEVQRRAADLFLTRQLSRMGMSVHALDSECRRIDALMAGLPAAPALELPAA